MKGNRIVRTPVHLTVDASIVVQVLTGLAGLAGLSYDLKGPHAILKAILLLETVVQAIELLFYVGLIRWLHVTDMAKVRYYDWIITTPTMLLTTVIYMTYERQRQEAAQAQHTQETNTQLEIWSFVKVHAAVLALLAASNWCMLACGFLAEAGVIGYGVACVAGFAFFGVTFATIWARFARHSDVGRRLFVFLTLVWAGYGCVFLLDAAPKNMALNFLDIVAKNFFGLYLFWKVQSVAKVDYTRAGQPERPDLQ